MYIWLPKIAVKRNGVLGHCTHYGSKYKYMHFQSIIVKLQLVLLYHLMRLMFYHINCLFIRWMKLWIMCGENLWNAISANLPKITICLIRLNIDTNYSHSRFIYPIDTSTHKFAFMFNESIITFADTNAYVPNIHTISAKLWCSTCYFR